MATKTITWSDGTTAVLTYSGQGSGTIVVQSDPNNHYESRSAQIIVKTTDGSNIQRTVTIQQAAKVRIDISSAVVTASTQTYTGSALTPTVHVILNGAIVDESGYDVAYSNNTNAGTATITVTGKNDYTGTATGTFTITKANPTYTAPSRRTGLTYSGSSQYLTTTGSTSHGTIYYSTDGSSWYTTRRTGTNAGTYSNYWKLVGDANHNDIASTQLGDTTIAKASRTLSFADAYVVLAPSGNVTKTATPSAGSGDGAITYSISSTTYATINSSTGAVTAKTSDGSAVVTATIAEGTNYLSATASYNLYVFATTHNFDYTGTVQNITLPPGSYKLQCWGAQGGSNAADATYGITAQAGGKGGYAEGVLTIAAQTTLYAFVGEQGASSGKGAWNGGGGSTGSSTKTSDNTSGLCKMGCGGGATDFALVTSDMSYDGWYNNRSDASLLSRIIVAGGGSGGAMCCVRNTQTSNLDTQSLEEVLGYINSSGSWVAVSSSSKYRSSYADVTAYRGQKCTITKEGSVVYYAFLTAAPPSSSGSVSYATGYNNRVTKSSNTPSVEVTVPSDAVYIWFMRTTSSGTNVTPSVVFTNITDTLTSQVGYAGGGTTGAGYNDAVKGKQNAAGTNAYFGKGAHTTGQTYYYVPGAGGGGWYGGGRAITSNNTSSVVKTSGGGSGFVNTAASAGNRPSGYTGIELDSGTTTAGSSSFPSTSGGTENGHSGNGYARITRL